MIKLGSSCLFVSRVFLCRDGWLLSGRFRTISLADSFLEVVVVLSLRWCVCLSPLLVRVLEVFFL